MKIAFYTKLLDCLGRLQPVGAVARRLRRAPGPLEVLIVGKLIGGPVTSMIHSSIVLVAAPGFLCATDPRDGFTKEY